MIELASCLHSEQPSLRVFVFEVSREAEDPVVYLVCKPCFDLLLEGFKRVFPYLKDLQPTRSAVINKPEVHD